ncbi:hypothetical protein [Cyanothece sp. BG0011]|nr:hypothetical protein [Cyanothece sp. BG0011]
MIIIQDRGHVTVLNPGDEADINYSLLPFLYQQGVNQIDTMIITNNHHNFSLSDFENKIKIATIINLFDEDKLTKDQTQIEVNSTRIKAVNQIPLVVEWTSKNQSWLWIDSQQKDPNLMIPTRHQSSEIILWSGKKLSLNWIQSFKTQKVKLVIISTHYLSNFMQKELTKQNIEWYWIQEIGAIQWIPKQGLKPLLKNQEQDP